MSEGDSLMGFDSNIHNEEDLYQRYPLIDFIQEPIKRLRISERN